MSSMLVNTSDKIDVIGLESNYIAEKGTIVLGFFQFFLTNLIILNWWWVGVEKNVLEYLYT